MKWTGILSPGYFSCTLVFSVKTTCTHKAINKIGTSRLIGRQTQVLIFLTLARATIFCLGHLRLWRFNGMEERDYWRLIPERLMVEAFGLVSGRVPITNRVCRVTGR